MGRRHKNEGEERVHLYAYLLPEDEATLKVLAALNSQTLAEYISKVLKEHVSAKQVGLVKEIMRTIK